LANSIEGKDLWAMTEIEGKCCNVRGGRDMLVNSRERRKTLGRKKRNVAISKSNRFE
jgi:hypothetical protein